MRFIIRGHIVPYVRMTRRGKWVNERAQRYLDSQQAIAWQMRAQMVQNGWEMLPEQTPLGATLAVQVSERMHCSDLDNIVKAVVDSAQGLAFNNDLWIDHMWAWRSLGDEDVAVLTLGVIEGDTDAT